MHEFGIIEDIVRLVGEKAADHGVHRVTCVRLRVGRLRQVEPASLRFAFETLARGTIMEDALLDVDFIPIRLRCRHCGNEFELADALPYQCSQCNGRNVDVSAGKELILKDIEGE